MSDLAREFIKKHADDIICEPSGSTYKEFLEDKIQSFRLVKETLSKELEEEEKKGIKI